MADTMVYQAEKSLKELGDKVDSGLKMEVESKIADVKKALESDDKARIVSASEALQQAMSQMGQAMYQQQQAQPGSNGSHSAPGDTSRDDEDVVEGEYTTA